jgi:hypothetical protein
LCFGDPKTDWLPMVTAKKKQDEK